MGERAPPVDVRDEKDQRLTQLGDAHVGHVDVPQVELSRTTCALHHHEVDLRFQGPERRLDVWPERSGATAPRRPTELMIDLPHQDDLAPGIPFGFDEDWIHADVWLDPSR